LDLSGVVQGPNFERVSLIATSDFHRLGELKELVEFRAAATGLTTMEFLAHLPNLQILDLGWNPELSTAEFPSNMPSLTHLIWDGAKPPESLFQTDAPLLIHLSISFLGLSTLPEITGMANLKHLDLSRNQFIDFEFLQHHPNLRTLNLDHNQIDALQFPSEHLELRALHLKGNLLSSIHLETPMPNLSELHVGFNHIDNLSFENLDHLRVFDLRSNNLSTFHLNPVLRQLEYLNLEDNKLKSFTCLGSFPKLRELNLKENIELGFGMETYALPDCFPNLVELNLSLTSSTSLRLPLWQDKLEVLDITFSTIRELILPLKMASLREIRSIGSPLSMIRAPRGFDPLQIHLVRLPGASTEWIPYDFFEMHRQNGEIMLYWSQGRLQQTDALNNNLWENVQGAVSPHQVDTSTGVKFFRVSTF